MLSKHARRRALPLGLLLGLMFASVQPASADTNPLPKPPDLTANPADLTATMSVSPTQVLSGGLVTLSAIVKNVPATTRIGPGNGTATATNVSVWLTVPEGATVVTQPAPTANTGNFTCAIETKWIKCSGGTLAAGGSATITAMATIQAPQANVVQGGTVFWLALIDPENKVPERDEMNNVGLASIGVSAMLPDLVIKSFTVAATPGLPAVTYTAEIGNVGTVGANNVSVQVIVPAPRNGGSEIITPSGGLQCGTSFALQGDVVTCASGSIPASGSITLTIVSLFPGPDVVGEAQVVADPNNVLIEADETNNSRTLTVGF